MRFKPNYIVIPLVTVATTSIGSFITSRGMDWYDSLAVPAFTPPGSFIGTVWTTLFILATLAALIVWNKPLTDSRRHGIAITFIFNAMLNVGWSALFFGLHRIEPAIFEAVLLGLSVLVLIIIIWPVSKFVAWLLMPYLAWVSFATFLTYSIWTLNK